MCSLYKPKSKPVDIGEIRRAFIWNSGNGLLIGLCGTTTEWWRRNYQVTFVLAAAVGMGYLTVMEILKNVNLSIKQDKNGDG